MENSTLEKIKNFAINALRDEQGYCGVASSEHSAIITSELKSGFDVKITIEAIEV